MSLTDLLFTYCHLYFCFAPTNECFSPTCTEAFPWGHQTSAGAKWPDVSHASTPVSHYLYVWLQPRQPHQQASKQTSDLDSERYVWEVTKQHPLTLESLLHEVIVRKELCSSRDSMEGAHRRPQTFVDCGVRSSFEVHVSPLENKAQAEESKSIKYLHMLEEKENTGMTSLLTSVCYKRTTLKYFFSTTVIYGNQ